MLGKIFAILTLSSTLFAALTGRMAAVSAAVLEGASMAVNVTVGLLGLMCLFGGIMQVLRAAGVLARVCRRLRPLLRFAFPQAVARGEGEEELAAAIGANLLGMGNAATPFALAAMPRLMDPAHPDAASDDAITLAVLSTAPFSLIPSTMLAMRHAAGSLAPTAVLLPIWLVSLLSSVFSVLLCRLLARLFPL